jgi:hypothetical protein
MKTQVNEIKITYQGGIRAKEWKKINGSQSAAKLIYEHWDKGTIGLFECFKVVLMNNGNRVKGIYQISQGGITGTLVDLRILNTQIPECGPDRLPQPSQRYDESKPIRYRANGKDQEGCRTF